MNSVLLTGQTGLNPTLVGAENSKVTLSLNVDSCKSQFMSTLHKNSNKICKRCFLCRSLEFCSPATNTLPVFTLPPVGARLQEYWEKWEVFLASPKVVTMMREGYTSPFRFRPNLTWSPTVISHYQNPV